MIVIIDKRTGQLRGAFEDGTPIDLQEEMIVTPRRNILDLNKNNVAVFTYDGDIPVNWRRYTYVYRPESKEFEMV